MHGSIRTCLELCKFVTVVVCDRVFSTLHLDSSSFLTIHRETGPLLTNVSKHFNVYVQLRPNVERNSRYRTLRFLVSALQYLRYSTRVRPRLICSLTGKRLSFVVNGCESVPFCVSSSILDDRKRRILVELSSFNPWLFPLKI